MKRSVLIIQSTVACALIGLCVSYLTVNNLPDVSSEGRPQERLLLLLIFGLFPPLVGAVAGLVVGVIAAVVGRYTDPPEGPVAKDWDETEPYAKK
jgi:hypothetical protein